jgi:hypothetical protein
MTRDDSTRPIGLQSDLDAANAARAIRLKLRRITKRRHKAATFVAVDEIEQGFAGLETEWFAVDEGGEGGEILDHGRPFRQPAGSDRWRCHTAVTQRWKELPQSEDRSALWQARLVC